MIIQDKIKVCPHFIYHILYPLHTIFFEKGGQKKRGQTLYEEKEGQTLYENIKKGYDLVFFEKNFFILLLHFTFFLLSIHKKLTCEQYSGTYEYRKDFR